MIIKPNCNCEECRKAILQLIAHIKNDLYIGGFKVVPQ